MTLSLTPKAMFTTDQEAWDSGDVGGWELWLAGEEEGGDEATYQTKPVTELKINAEEKEEGMDQDEQDEEEEEEEDDDGPLLSLEPSWNRLSIVLRDEGVLKFVKYVSGRASGSRWDIGSEFQVEGMEEESEDEEAQ